MSTPTEQIGFQASEEYTSRMSSPRPQSGYGLAHSNTSGTHVDSPLRKESFPADGTGKSEFEGTLSKGLHAPSDTALESEVEDEDTIHVDEPSRRINKIYGGAGRLESTEDLGPHSGYDGEEDGIHDEHGYGAPILASDEVAKEPFGWELQPAVSPMNDRRGSYHDDHGYHPRSGSGSQSNSRPSSRPGSIHGNIPGLRIADSTPLEDLEEYEPLFPEEEKNAAATKQKPLAAADRLKRPELKNRKFPSQDVWEDTPNSLKYTATVSSPQLPGDTEETKDKAPEGETPEHAFARRQEELAEEESQDSESFLHQEKKSKPWAKSHLMEETRPGLKQRFPSRDIWEDTPDSLQLQTTVNAPQAEEILSPPDERPTTGAVAYHQEKAAAGLPMGSEEGRATTGIAATMKPQIPARPVKSKLPESPEKAPPVIPDRPPQRQQQVPPIGAVLSTSPPVPTKTKPQVPARPSKPITRESSESVPLTTVLSNSSAKSIDSDSSAAAAAKPKPPVPSRPVGSKIAALQGGFMSDLNKRLQLGPQPPKKDEPAPEEPVEEKEKAPLVDARKGRARGPARRAPAKSPTPATETAAEKLAVLGFSIPSTVWQMDPDEDYVCVAWPNEDAVSPVNTKAVVSETPTLATNTAGEAVHDKSEIAPGADITSAPSSVIEDVHAEQEELNKAAVLAESSNHELEPVKSKDEPPVVSQSTLAPEPADEEDLAGSTGTRKPSTES
jgi:hypothetical protein